MIMQQEKVVIHIEGGTVQQVWASDRDIEVVVIDFDNLDAEGIPSAEQEQILNKAVEGLEAA